MNSIRSAVPILLGRISAGPPLEAVADPERAGWLHALDRPGLYTLRVRGDSMIGAGIFDGDLAVIRPGRTAREGQIVVALIDGAEATLKRFYFRAGRVILAPENPDRSALCCDPERVEIQGVLHAIVRSYRD